MDRSAPRQAGAITHHGAHRPSRGRQPGPAPRLAGGINELKIDHGLGYRVYYHQRGATVVILLCGGDKATQSNDIRNAQAMVRHMET